MKGMLFSADFVTDNSNDIKLLEVNTDTAFISASLNELNYTEIINVLSTNDITKVHVIYKIFQENFVLHFSQSLHESASFINSFEFQLEDNSSIYQSNIPDEIDKFIFRLAYDEGALFDSIYAKNNAELFKLFIDNDDSGSITKFAYSSSDAYEFDNLGIDTINSSSNLPDVVAKDTLTYIDNPLKFYKTGNTGSSLESRLDDLKNELLAEDKIIQKYYTSEESETHVKSIRSFNILYGSNIDLIILGEYEINAILEKPISLDVDNSSAVNELPIKHYYEFTTNGIRGFIEGVLEGGKVVPESGSAVLIENVNIGEKFKSFLIPGSPNSDKISEIREWSYPGSVLPSGSVEMVSTLVNKTKSKLKYNVISNLSISGSIDDSLRLSPYLHMLTYDIQNDIICYRSPSDIHPETHMVFDMSGSLVALDDSRFEILEGDNYAYSLDMEEVDTFFLGGTNINIKLLTHNCFIEGTKISIPGGHKNIEDLNPGDTIVSYDKKTQKINESKIGRLSSSSTNNLIKITFDDSTTIHVTKTHPFYVTNGCWYDAQHLEKGFKCLKQNGKESSILNIEIIETDTIVYNLHDCVPAHTFYANDILVHNKCFTYDSQVEMWNGTKKSIGDIKIGDEVKSNKNNEITKGIVTDVLIHPTDDIVPVVVFGTMTSEPNHPYFYDNKWLPISNLKNSEYKFQFVENYYNLEIDGNKINNSEHNFIIENIIVSGLGDNKILNSKYMRQPKELLKL